MFEGEESFAVANRYLHGPQVDRFFADENAVGDVLWSLADHQGTVRDVINQDPANASASEVVNHLDYDAFGGIASQTDAGFEPAFTYTGREWDADAELYHYRARWYDAGAGRFLSEDPLGFDGGDVNLTRYVGNNTINSVDPSGLRVASAVTTSLAGAFGGPAAAVAAIPTSFAGAGLGGDRFNVPLVTARLNGNRLTPVGSNAFPRLPVDPFEGATLLPVPAPPLPHISDLFVAGYRHQAFMADLHRGGTFTDEIRSLVDGVVDAGNRLQQAIMRPFAAEAETLRTAARSSDSAGVANRLQAELRANVIEAGGAVISSFANPIGTIRGFAEGIENSIDYGYSVGERRGTFSGIVAAPLHFVGGVGVTELFTGQDFLTEAPLFPTEAASRGSDGLNRISGALLTTAGGLRGTRAGRIDVGEGARALLRDESGSVGFEPSIGRSQIANPVPRRLARAIDAEFANTQTIGAPGASEVFVTGAGVRDVGRIVTSDGLARRLTLVDKRGDLIPGPRIVIEFDRPAGIATPINRTRQGFVGGGRTAGNAREFVIPNFNISDLENVTVRFVQ